MAINRANLRSVQVTRRRVPGQSADSIILPFSVMVFPEIPL